MATAISNTFGITSDPIVISQVTATNIQETTADHLVYSNSQAGSAIMSIRTSGPYDANSTVDIAQGTGAIFYEIKTAEHDLTTAFSSINLSPGMDHYIGVVQQYDQYYSAPHFTTSFKTASYPQEGLIPYQVSPYPNRYNYRDVPVLAELGYGWGGDQPITFVVNKLPAGLQMDTTGKVTGSPTSLGVMTGVDVTATNASGSRAGLSTFDWTIDRLTGEVPQPPDGSTGIRKRSELFEATRQYAEREDIDVEAMLTTMLIRADAQISRELRTRNMSDKVFIPIVDGSSEYFLPDDYELLENIQIHIDNCTPITPRFVTSEQGNYRAQHNEYYFTIENNKFRFVPPIKGEGTIEVTYFKTIPFMDTDDSGNWLLDRWFDIYHNAMMIEVSAFVKDKEELSSWKALFEESLESAKSRSSKDMWTTPGLQVKLEHV